MTDATLRFLQEISDRVGHNNVAEIHLFATIKQGAQESAIAVVATTPESTTPTGLERHVIFTARYRQTVKGPDRGKWEFDLKLEADATLITVDEVVRGVGMRSGDAAKIERLSGDEFRALVPRPPEPELAPVLPEDSDIPLPDSVEE